MPEARRGTLAPSRSGAGPITRFGAQRLLRSGPEKWLYRIIGIGDPAHYLHFHYLTRLLRRVPDDAPRRILDAGCGAGDFALYFAGRFPDAEVTGVDMDPAMLERARSAAAGLGVPNVSFHLGDLGDLSPTGDFDLVCAIDVLEHIPAQREVLHRLREALRPGGIAFFHIPLQRPRPVPFSRFLRAFHRWAADEHLAEEHTAESFLDAVREAGFGVDRATPTFGFHTGELATSLFNLPYARTTLNQLLQGLATPMCRLLALADLTGLDRPHFALAVEAHRALEKS